MTSVLDLWRWLDPSARLVSGAPGHLARPVRSVDRTRAAPPHLPRLADGGLLVADAAIIIDDRLDPLVAALHDAGLAPAAVWIAAVGPSRRYEAVGADLPILASERSPSEVARRAAHHLERERDELTDFAAALRLAAAEAALADPQVAAPAGIVAARLRRGIAVSSDGALTAVTPRPAGRALATRFVAFHGRLPPGGSLGGSGPTRRRRVGGLDILERPIEAGGTRSSVWLFDDLPPARVDEAALEALATTLRALLRRRPAGPAEAREARRVPPSTGHPLHDTLLAVARANGRITPAARALGVHRNTVLHRLRKARAELGLDPRRAEDALRLLEGAARRD